MLPSAVAVPPAPPTSALVDQFGRVIPPTNDPAWQPPREASTSERVAQAGVIYREIPISVIATGWDIPSARVAMNDLVLGLFDSAAQITDSVIRSDSRVQSALSSRLSILGRPVDFRIPRRYRDSALARECLDAFVDAWPTMTAESSMGEIQRWAIMMGFGPAQLLWDTSGEYAVPHPQPWHPRYVYYHWLYRCYVAITLDGHVAIDAGNGSWLNHAPHGAYRGWMRGAIGAVTPWWLARHYALRDWARYSERHGLPMIKAKTPAVGDPYQQAAFRTSLGALGQESVIHLPQNPPPQLSYDVELLEAKDTAHEGFRMLIEQCNGEITLALLAQTLTTSMPAEGGSSYAAARVHAGVMQALLEADARALATTLYTQLARPFAAINFGDPELAPRVVWDVTPFEDAATKANAFQAMANALNMMKTAGYEMDPDRVARLLRDTIPGFDPGEVKLSTKIAEVFAYDLDRAVVNINEARARKGLPPRAGGEKTWPEIAAEMGIGPGGGGSEAGAGARGVRQRIAALAARFDPRRAPPPKMRIKVAEESDELREALAEIEAAHNERAHARRFIP